MNPEHKKYILENMAKKSPAEIASELGIKERNVKKFIRMEGRVHSPSGATTVTEPKVPARPVPVKKAMILASIVLIIILGFAVYANSLNGKFVYDDDTLIKNNALTKDWSLLPKVFTEDIGKGAGRRYTFYRPIQIITYAVDYHMWKLNVAGYHLTSIILHILVALCIYWLITMLFDNKITSLLTAALFVVHPIHTTVVSYISTRAESLCLLFMLVSFIFYIKSLKTGGVIYYIIMISGYSLALLSKENALILPALILLYHYTFKEKMRFREFLSIAGIAFIYVLLRVTVLKHLMASFADNGTLLQRIPSFFVAIAAYLRLFFLPFGLHIEYGKDLFSFADPKAILGLGILAGLIFCVFRTVKTNRLVFFSLSWFLITLVPVSNLYPLNAYMSENWLYLPSIGLFLALGGSLSSLYRQEKYRIPALIFTLCLLVFYSYLTVRQNETWRDPLLFYKRTLKYAPNSSRMYNNIAYEYYKMGRKEEAIPMYEKALELDPNYAGVYNDLAIIYNETGRKEKSITMCKKALEINPDQAASYNNLGSTYYDMGKKEEAIEMFKKAIQAHPYDVKAYYNLAFAYDKMGRKDEAISMYKKALEINPNYFDACNNLGNLYYSIEKAEEAVAMYKKALEISPDNTNAYSNLGNTYYSMGRKEDAISTYKKMIELNPANAGAYNTLGNIYYQSGKKEEAAAVFKNAIDIIPDNAQAYNNLGFIRYSMGRKEEAIYMYKKAIALKPDYADAYNNLGVAYFELGMRQDAVAAFKKALELNPDQADARRNLDAIAAGPR